MIKKTTALAALLSMALLAPTLAAAQAAPGPRIGVVSIRALVQGSTQAKEKFKALNEEFAQRERQLQAKQKELKDRQAKLQKDLQVMGAEERRSAEAKFRDDDRDLTRRVNEFQEDLNVRRNEVAGRLQEDLYREVRAYAVANGYDLVVSASGVVHVAQGVDRTGKVRAAVEAKAKPGAKPAAKP